MSDEMCTGSFGNFSRWDEKTNVMWDGCSDCDMETREGDPEIGEHRPVFQDPEGYEIAHALCGAFWAFHALVLVAHVFDEFVDFVDRERVSLFEECVPSSADAKRVAEARARMRP